MKKGEAAGRAPATSNRDSQVAPTPSKLRLFGDWIAGCDNVGDCTATSLLPDGDRETDAVLSMSASRTSAGEVLLKVNERQFAREVGAVVLHAADGAFTTNDDLELKGEQAERFLRLTFNGKPILVAEPGGERLGLVSSAGLEQALAHIRRVQRSLGSKRQSLPVVQTARAAGARPVAVTKGQLHNLQQQLRRSHPDCVGDYPPTLRVLDADHMLGMITCWAGAKNGLDAVYVATRTPRGVAITPARFDYVPGYEPGDLVFLNNATVDEHSQTGALTLGQFFGGSGASDPHAYGPILDYVWDGTQFRLTKLTEATQGCDDPCRDFAGYHDEITTWRAKAVRR